MSQQPETAEALRCLVRARHQAETLGNLIRALELAGEAGRAAADPEVRFHLRRFLRWLLPRLDPRHDVPGLVRALGLEEHAPHAAAPSATEIDQRSEAIGEAWLPLVDPETGEAFLARIVVRPAPGERELLPPGSTAALAESVERAKHAVLRRLLGGGLTPRPELIAARRLELRGRSGGTVPVEGGSAGAAAAVAICSAMTDLPVPADLVFTGAIGPAGELLPVVRLEAKVAAARRERPWLRAILAPACGAAAAANEDSHPRRVSSVGELLDAVFGSRLAASAPAAVDLEGALRLGTELYEKVNDFPAALAVLETALTAIADCRRGDPATYRAAEHVALWRAGSCRMHLGDLDAAAALFERASPLGEALWGEGLLSPQAYVGFRGNLAVLLRDLFRYSEAEALLRANIDLQRELRQDRRELGRTLGNLGELLTFAGRLDEAERTLHEALEHMRAAYPAEVPRELCYLGNLALRRGAAAPARVLFAEGLRANSGVAAGRAANDSFLRYGLTRALHALGQPREADTEASAALAALPPTRPFPRQLILKVRGLARLALRQRDDGRADLRQAADLTFARGALLRFGLGTALAELAIELLAAGTVEEQAEAVDPVRRFAAAVRAVPGLPDAATRAAALEALLEDHPLDGEALAAALRAAVACFPY